MLLCNKQYKKFKNYFLETRNNFDLSVQEIFTIDAQQLDTSDNLELVIKEINSVVYKSPNNFFNIDENEKTNLGFQTKIPPQFFIRNTQTI